MSGGRRPGAGAQAAQPIIHCPGPRVTVTLDFEGALEVAATEILERQPEGGRQ